jgi:hypothetical protein
VGVCTGSDWPSPTDADRRVPSFSSGPEPRGETGEIRLTGFRGFRRRRSRTYFGNAGRSADRTTSPRFPSKPASGIPRRGLSDPNLPPRDLKAIAGTLAVSQEIRNTALGEDQQKKDKLAGTVAGLFRDERRRQEEEEHGKILGRCREEGAIEDDPPDPGPPVPAPERQPHTQPARPDPVG